MDKLKTDFVDLNNKIKSKPTPALFEELTNLFKVLRTVCASDEEVRKTLFDSIIELKLMKELLEFIFDYQYSIQSRSCEKESSQGEIDQCVKSVDICFKIGLQVIGNTIVQNNAQCVKLIWEELKDFLLGCYEDEYGDKKLNDILIMILYNVYKYFPNISEDSSVLNVFVSQAKVNNEFAFFFLEDFVYSKQKSETKFKQFFESLENEQLSIVLEFAKRDIKLGLDVEYFMKFFNDHMFKILKNNFIETDIEPIVINLELLTGLSSHPDFQDTMQNNGTMVSNAFEFLKTMHLVGKQDSSSKFAPDPKLSNMFDPQLSYYETCIGLKTTCVSLVANLCWLHRANQDQARTSELLPVLLECCNLDAKNPLLKEYSVFAIANCCRHNTANQEYIANLSKKGDYTFDSETGVNLAPGVNIGTLNKNGNKST